MEQRDLECGCRVEVDPDGPLWVLAMCTEHANLASKLDINLPRLLDHELDVYVAQFSSGRRVKRIRPADPHRGV